MKLRSSLRAHCVAAVALIVFSIASAQAADPEYAVQIDAPKDLRTLLENNLRVVRVVRKGTTERRFRRLTDRAEIERFQRADPLYNADIWETVEVRAFNKRLG